MSRWAAEISGPIWVASSSGSPTRSACTCGSSSSRKRSSASSCTRMRERAQQSWPALPNTADGAAAAAASRSASANTMFADLPPSSSVTRLIVAAAPAAIERPTSVEPVNAILATSGCSTRRCPHVRPGPTTTFTTPSGRPASRASSREAQRRQRRQLRRLEHDRVARRERRRELPRRDRQREVPRRDQTDDAERLAHRERLAARDRDRVAEQPLGRARVVAERVDHHAHLAARVGDRLAGVARLEHRQLLAVLAERVGERVQHPRALAGRQRAPRRQRRRRARDRLVDLLDARARDLGEHRLRGGLED